MIKTLIAIGFMTTAIGRTQETVDETPREPTRYQRGLAYLARVQNTDGSWGTGTGSVYITSFAVLAFLNHGELPYTEYGTNVTESLKWLLRQTPSNDLDRASMIHALTAGYRMTGVPVLGGKVTHLRAGVDQTRLSELSAVLFQITIPPEIPYGCRVSTINALRQFVAHPTGPPPLQTYLEALAMLVDGGPKWKDYNQQTLGPLFKTQAADGSFPFSEARSSVESTTFALLRISVYYRYWTYYLDIGYPKQEEPNTKAEVREKID